MIDRLLEDFEGEDAAVACIYCDFYDHETQTSANMVGALTKQLVNSLSIVPVEIEEAFGRAEHKVGGRGLRLAEAVKLLGSALAPAKRTFICIDAIDEVQINIYPNFWTHCIPFLRRFQASGYSSLGDPTFEVR